MACLFIEIFWSVGETILKQYWKILNFDFDDTSNNYYFSYIYFTSTTWKTAIRTAQQSLIFLFSKTSRGSYLDLESPFLSKYLKSISWPVPLRKKKKYTIELIILSGRSSPENPRNPRWKNWRGTWGPGFRIRIRSGQWIRFRIRNPDPNQDPGGQNDPQKQKKLRNFMFWSAGCSLSSAEGFFCNLDALYEGLGIVKL